MWPKHPQTHEVWCQKKGLPLHWLAPLMDNLRYAIRLIPLINNLMHLLYLQSYPRLHLIPFGVHYIFEYSCSLKGLRPPYGLEYWVADPHLSP